MLVDVIIPAYNEEQSIAKVIDALPKQLIREIVVCNNLSTDETAKNAEAAGASVILADKKGYGSACLAGLEYLKNKETTPDVVAFIDGDFSDYPDQLSRILEPIELGKVQLVIGSRDLGNRQEGAMLPHQKFGNWLATRLIYFFWQVQFTDLGPFRAITWDALDKIKMADPDFGWTVEMQVKAAKMGIPSCEVPVDYRVRAHGQSKVSGNLKNSYLAGQKILWTIFANL